MNGHGYVTLPSRLVGAVLGDSDVSTSAAWSTSHSAIHPLVTRGRGPLHLWRVCILPCGWVAPLDGQASWVNPCVRTLSLLSPAAPSCVTSSVLAKGSGSLLWLVVDPVVGYFP